MAAEAMFVEMRTDHPVRRMLVQAVVLAMVVQTAAPGLTAQAPAQKTAPPASAQTAPAGSPLSSRGSRQGRVGGGRRPRLAPRLPDAERN